jgi:hypothetical protein
MQVIYTCQLWGLKTSSRNRLHTTTLWINDTQQVYFLNYTVASVFDLGTLPNVRDWRKATYLGNKDDRHVAVV